MKRCSVFLFLPQCSFLGRSWMQGFLIVFSNGVSRCLTLPLWYTLILITKVIIQFLWHAPDSSKTQAFSAIFCALLLYCVFFFVAGESKAEVSTDFCLGRPAQHRSRRSGSVSSCWTVGEPMTQRHLQRTRMNVKQKGHMRYPAVIFSFVYMSCPIHL